MSEVYHKISEYTLEIISVILSIAVISVMLISVPGHAEKAEEKRQFPEGFYKGCDWISDNTPEDSIVFTAWHHRSRYHCERDVLWFNLPDFWDIVFGTPEETYEGLSRHGIDYVYVQEFSIRGEEFAYAYPESFVEKLHEHERIVVVYHEYDVIVFEVR